MVAKAYHINSNLYHYAGNNPVKYTDPDGRDIKESSLGEISVALIGAVCGNIGVAKDSNGDLALYMKFEAGIGFGGDLIKFGNILNTFDKITGFIADFMNDIDAIENVISTPEDTGEGNFSDLPNILGIFSFKHESSSSWNGNIPVEGAVLVGAQGDKDGNTEITVGLTAIAAAYLIEETLYLNISSIIDYIKSNKNNEE